MNQPRIRTVAKLAIATALASGMTLLMATAPASAAPASPPAASAALAKMAPVKPAASISFTIRRVGTAPAGSSKIGRSQSVNSVFEVVAINSTGQNFDTVALAYNRFSNPFSQVLPLSPFLNGQSQVWDVDNCEDVNQFALGLFNGGALVFNTGNITRDVCSEVIQFS